MRASRLVSILLMLQTRGRLTAQQLADELEVSVRTIYRDVESLHAAGIPLYGDAGHSGGYRLVDGYRTRLTGLTGEEAESLFLSGLPGPAADLGLGPVVAAAQLKLMAALPSELRDRAARFSARFHLDAPSWYHDVADETPYLSAVADAVWNQRRIEIGYHRWKAPQDVTRVLDPYGVVLKAGRWYLVAKGSERMSTYRVSQIFTLRTLDEEFERPVDFDLAGFWRSYLDDFQARQYTGEATVRLTARGVERIPDLLHPAVVRSAVDTATTPDVDGAVTAVIPIESIDHAVGELLRLGTDVEVLAPAELRSRIAATVETLAATYRGIAGLTPPWSSP